MKVTARHLEIAAARHFDYRQNLIVPNVSWGFSINHEADLVVVSKARNAIEIEISISDFRKDQEKKKFKYYALQNDFRQFYYLMPIELYNKHYGEITETINLSNGAGLLVAEYSPSRDSWYVKVIFPATINRKAIKVSESKYLHLCHLAAMRIWTLKERLIKK
jgi:hypothetical protein